MDNDPVKFAVQIGIAIAAPLLVAWAFKGSSAVKASVATVVMANLLHELLGDPLAEPIRQIGS